VYDDVAPDTIRVYDQSIRLQPKNGASSPLIPQYRYGDASIPLLDRSEPLKNECSEFVAAIRTGRPVTSDGWDGLRVVRILEAASRSMCKGGAMERVIEAAALPHVEAVPAPTLTQEPTL